MRSNSFCFHLSRRAGFVEIKFGTNLSPVFQFHAVGVCTISFLSFISCCCERIAQIIWLRNCSLIFKVGMFFTAASSMSSCVMSLLRTCHIATPVVMLASGPITQPNNVQNASCAKLKAHTTLPVKRDRFAIGFRHIAGILRGSLGFFRIIFAIDVIAPNAPLCLALQSLGVAQ